MTTPDQILKQAGNTWAGQYKDERWKDRARNFRRDRGNSCSACKQSGKIIHVHHIAYDPGVEIWDASDDDLALLCEQCHKDLTAEFRKFRKYVFGKLNANLLRVLNGALLVGLEHNDRLQLVYAITEMCASPRSVKLFADAWVNSKPKEPTK